MDERLSNLRCPRCREALALEGGGLTCAGCSAHYPVVGGTIPAFGLWADDRPEETGRDANQVWSREEFERGYELIGYHEKGTEFDKRLGYPPLVSEFLFDRVKKRMSAWVEPGPDHRILDVGCGAGYFLLLLRERYRERGFTPRLHGLDASRNQVSYMVRRMAKDGLTDVTAVHGNAEYLPFPDEAFDLVTCSEVLEHVRNPERALREMRRVLKPEALLLLSTPSMSAQRGWGRILAPAAWVVKKATRYTSDPDSIDGGYDIPWYAGDFRKAVEGSGFRILDFEHNAVIPHPWHFRFVPGGWVGPLVRVFTFADRRLKFALRPLALHFVVRARKGEAAPA